MKIKKTTEEGEEEKKSKLGLALKRWQKDQTDERIAAADDDGAALLANFFPNQRQDAVLEPVLYYGPVEERGLLEDAHLGHFLGRLQVLLNVGGVGGGDETGNSDGHALVQYSGLREVAHQGHFMGLIQVFLCIRVGGGDVHDVGSC